MSDHWDGKRFFNPQLSTDKRIRDVWRLYRATDWPQWPRRIADPPCPPPPASAALKPGEAAITFIGHSTFLIQAGGVGFLTDPVFSLRAGPGGRLGPVRVRPPALAIDRLPAVDVVLVSHNHYDHLNVPSLRVLARHHRPRAVTGLGNAPLLRRSGLATTDELDWWQTIAGPNGTRITFVPAQHWSARGMFDRRRTLWGGFIIEAGDVTVYFAGDSGYCPHFQEIRRRIGRIDVALLPIGAYEPRWFMAPQHMDPDEAVQAHLDLAARQSIAMHFGTFQLTSEPIDAPVTALRHALNQRGIPPSVFRVPGFGETVLVQAPFRAAASDQTAVATDGRDRQNGPVPG